MRNTAILALIVAANLFATTALAGGTYYIRKADGTREQVTCDLNDRTVENVDDVAWNPPCTELTSGDVVTWVWASGLHDPGSQLDGNGPSGSCFRMTESETYGNGLTQGVSYPVRFTFDSAGVTASYWFRLGNGQEFWSDPAACTFATDITQSTLSTAVIPYKCYIHENMQGLIVVHKLGGVG